MNTSELTTQSNLFPAFVEMHNVPNINSTIVRSDRELGEWYTNYDGCHSWFEDGALYERNFHGQVRKLCKADTEEEAYFEMALRAQQDDNVWIETESNILEQIADNQEEPEVPQWDDMVETLRQVKTS